MSLSQLISIILILISIAFSFLAVWPRYQQFVKLSDDLNLKKKELAQLEAYFDNLKTTEERLEPYQKQLAVINIALPDRLSVPEFFLYLQAEAEKNGLVLGDLKDPVLADSGIKPGLQEISFDISLSGTYFAFKNFLSDIWQNAKLIEVDSISFSSKEKKPTPQQPEIEQKESVSSNVFNFKLKLKTYGYSIY